MVIDLERRLKQADYLQTDYLSMHYIDYSQNDSQKRKTCEWISVCMILEGKKQININHQCELFYDKNSFVTLPPYSDISVRTSTPAKAVVLGLNKELVQNIKKRVAAFQNQYEWINEDPQYLNRWNSDLKMSVNKILKVILYSKKDKGFFVDLYAQELAYNLLQLKNINQLLNLEEDDFVSLAIKYLKENHNTPANIKTAARHFNMSESSFSQTFKKATGISPKDYLTSFKLSRAKELLKTTNVTETAFNLGYENISHFINLFKKEKRPDAKTVPVAAAKSAHAYLAYTVRDWQKAL